LQVIARDVHNLYANGMADSIDILETDLALQKGQQQVILQKANQANALASLTRLIGLDPADDLKLTESPDQPTSPHDADLPTELDRPELRQFDHAIAAADKVASVEQSAVLPSLSSYAGYSYGMPNRDTFNKSWNGNFIFGVKLNWEFNLGRKTLKAVEAARSRAASVRMAQKNLEDALLTQRDLALNNLDHAFQTSQITKTEFDIAGRQYQLARLRQEAGQISVNRLLEMEADLTVSEQQYRASIIQYYLTENDYLYAVGSGRIFGGLR
jgi:outer membrane protein TolC